MKEVNNHKLKSKILNNACTRTTQKGIHRNSTFPVNAAGWGKVHGFSYITCTCVYIIKGAVTWAMLLQLLQCNADVSIARQVAKYMLLLLVVMQCCEK